MTRPGESAEAERRDRARLEAEREDAACEHIRCTVCRVDKVLFELTASSIKNRHRARRRCKKCHVCSQCHRELDGGAFTADAAVCRKCEMLLCDVCKKEWPATRYRLGNLRGHRDGSHISPLVCADCEERGCTSRATQLRACTECSVEYGIEEFSHRQWENITSDHPARLACLMCQARLDAEAKRSRQEPTLSCAVCQKEWPISKLRPANVKAHRAESHKSPLVCVECE